MVNQWKRIGVTLKPADGEMTALLERVLAVIADRSLTVVLDQATAARVGGSGAPLAEVAARADLLIVLGGDGTVLAAARAIGERDVPILGINLGELGFLVDLHPPDIDELLPRILDGDYVLQQRSRLRVDHVSIDGVATRETGLVLNDVVLASGSPVGRLIELETRSDGLAVARYRGDGLILSTPTGSTAYNLSAGGPLLDPAVPSIILTPICPHTLSQRPLVLPDSMSISARVVSTDDVRVTLDGQVGWVLQPGESICVTRAEHGISFVAARGHDHFDTLRAKLGWGSR
jgi:NAD+ kinase